MPKDTDASKESTHHRSKYVAPSAKFSDWTNALHFERHWWGRHLLFLERRFGIKRLGYIFLFCMFLGFILILDVEPNYQYSLGQVADRDVRSPYTFELVDEISTKEKQVNEEAAQPPIFDYDVSINEDLLTQWPVALARMRHELSRFRDFPKKFKQNSPEGKLLVNSLHTEFEKILGRSLSEPLFRWLLAERFSPRIEGVISNALGVWKGERLISNLNDFVPKTQRTILVRDLTRPESENQRINKFLIKDLGRRDDFVHESMVYGFSTLNSSERKEVDSLIRSLLLPNLTLNKKETEIAKKTAREAVLPVVIAIKKGQALLREGQTVKPLHRAMMTHIKEIQDRRTPWWMSFVAGALIFTFVMVFLAYLRRFTLKRVKISNKEMLLMGVVTLLEVGATKILLLLSEFALIPQFKHDVPEDFFMYLAPVAAGTMMIGLMITAGEVVWLYAMFLSLVLAFLVDFHFSFIVMSLVGSIMAARAVFACRSRTDVYKAGIWVGLIQMGALVLTTLVVEAGDPELKTHLLWYAPAGFFAGVGSALMTLMFVPLVETVFNVTTDVKLMELSNLNHPLLKAMIVKAPGTYHHSLIVGAMAEAAGEEIGANPLLAKVMSYYHDIGKMDHAQYFIENQRPEYNPHDQISPYMSKTILIAHVKDGAEMGMKYKLGKPIIDGVLQHHGTTLISFFYNKALEGQDEEIDQVTEEDFRYPGPKPQFKEAALVMLADSVEAAARSLDEPTPSRLQNIVKNIIHRKFTDGQLDECDVTLRELTIIENCFNRILLGVYHHRLDYPKKAGGGTSEPPPPGFPRGYPQRSGRGPATA